jgi:hypothetical protein
MTVRALTLLLQAAKLHVEPIGVHDVVAGVAFSLERYPAAFELFLDRAFLLVPVLNGVSDVIGTRN